MTYSSRQLEQELAEVAAGRRQYVSPGTQSSVNFEERQAAEEHRVRAEATQKLGEQQLNALRERDQNARFDAEQMRSAIEHAAAEASSRHHDLMQAEEDRVEILRQAEGERNEILRDASERQDLHHQESMALQRQRIATDERTAEAQLNRHKAELEEGRLRNSPFYAAAKKLAQLQELKKGMKELDELKRLLLPAPALLKKLHLMSAGAIANLDDAAAARWEAQFAAWQVQSAAISKSKTETECRMADATAAVPAPTRTWKTFLFGDASAVERAKANSEITCLGEQLELFKCQLLQLEKSKPSKPHPCGLVPEVIRAQFEVADFRSEWSQMVDAVEAWRGDRYMAIEEMLPSYTGLDSPFDRIGWVEGDLADSLDFKMCATLEHVAAAGAVAVYPGLGEVPTPVELAVLIQEIGVLHTQFHEQTTYPWLCEGLEDYVRIHSAFKEGHFDKVFDSDGKLMATRPT